MRLLYSIFYLCIYTGLKSCNLAFQLYTFSLNAVFLTRLRPLQTRKKSWSHPRILNIGCLDLVIACLLSVEHVSSFALNVSGLTVEEFAATAHEN